MPDEQDAIVLVDGRYADSPGVHDLVSHGDRAAGQAHLIAGHRPDMSAEVLCPVDQLSLVRLVAQRAGPLAIGHDQDVALAAAESPAARRSSAARTSPANSGCARVGRERNSGCACVDT